MKEKKNSRVNNPRYLLTKMLSSDIKADLLTLFHKNPGIIDTEDGVSSRMGLPPESIHRDVRDLVRLGILQSEKFGAYIAISLDVKRDKEVQSLLGKYFQKRKTSRKA